MSNNLISFIDKDFLNISFADPRYDESPFKNLKSLPPKQKGMIFEKIVASVLSKKKHSVERPENTEHDLIVNKQKCEIKGSTLAKGTNNFTFLQIRLNQDYDYMLFAMFYPDEFVLMRMDKDIILKNISNGIFKPQHGGKKAKKGNTFCFYGNQESLLKIGAEFFV